MLSRIFGGVRPGVTSIKLAVSDEHDAVVMAADVYAPRQLTDKSVVLICMAGGNTTRGYFNLTGSAGGAQNFAYSMTALGHIVVAIEPVGVGDSTIPEDGFSVTIEAEAEYVRRATERVRQMTVSGAPLSQRRIIGLGHSAGSLVMGAAQGRFHCFDAVVLLGFSTRGMPDVLPPDVLAAISANPAGARAILPPLVKQMFGGAAYFPPQPDEDTENGRLLRRIRAPWPAMLGALAIIPGNIAPEVAAITSPVFVGVSEHDIVGPAHEIGAAFTACPDYTLFIIPGASHEIMVAEQIGALYRRLDAWLPAVAARGSRPER